MKMLVGIYIFHYLLVKAPVQYVYSQVCPVEPLSQDPLKKAGRRNLPPYKGPF